MRSTPAPGSRDGGTDGTHSTAMLDVEGLRTEIRLRQSVVHAVDGVSFTVGHGETVGLVGESGCGKTMTGLSITRLLPPGGRVVAGAVRLNGRELTTLPENEIRRVRGNEVGMVFQDPMTSLDPTMPIGRQIAEGVRAHRAVSRTEARDRACEVLDLVGLAQPRQRLDDYPHQLSGGMRQRVMIAMALSCEPKLLIADEPTTSLDVTIQAQILTLLDDLKARLGMSMLLITHDLGVIAGRADRVMVMYAGQIVEAADTTALFGSMRHRYTGALFESVRQLDRERTSTPLDSIPGLPPDLTGLLVGCRFAPRCRYASDICREQEPAMMGGWQPGSGHRYACWHPVDVGPPAPAPAAASLVAPAGSKGNRPEGSPDGPMLRLDHLVKEYPVKSGAVIGLGSRSVKAVSDVSFTVERGEIFGLVGESGCGKTTLARMTVGLENPTSGTVSFDGVDLTKVTGRDRRRLRRNLQLMFQDPYGSLDPRMRVGPIIGEPLVAQRVGTRRERDQRVSELVREVGLGPGSVGLYPHQFSGGQRQRIGMARALALNPGLIVADEPVSSLDVSIRSQVLNLMLELKAAHGLTFIVISHDLSVVRYLADRIGVMYLGKLVEIGSGADVYRRTAHPYTAGLLASIPPHEPQPGGPKRAAVLGELPSALTPPSGCRFRTRCPHAEARCAEEEPALRPFGPGHLAACHFPLRAPSDVPVAATSAASGGDAG